MNRRSLLGFLGGAAAAGPKLAADLAASSHAPGHAFAGSFLSSPETKAPIMEGNWERDRIAHLKKLITSGDPRAKERARQQRLYSLEQQERYRLDALRSVAPHHKFSMLMDGAEERQERIDRTGWEIELRRILES